MYRWCNIWRHLDSDHDLTTILMRNREWIAEKVENDPKYFGEALIIVDTLLLSLFHVYREGRWSSEASLPLLRML